MEQRIPLSRGTQVNRFVIDRVIGFGASCLVYEAHYLDSSNHRKEVILKECYPCNAVASRIGNKIIWSNSDEQEKAFLRFDNAYEIAAKIQNVAGAKSVSVYSLDKLAENSTQYVATIPNGTSYDKNESKDIADIIRTALALTNAVGLYHKAGYLHLDIKPSNFIATEDQTGKGKNIVLFDVDTVVSQDDFQNGNFRDAPYSDDYAAPEQKLQELQGLQWRKEICPATDLFAVGAVLFERIMNRPVSSADSKIFSDWEYDERFDSVNPKAKRLLTEIFHKTLAANVKRRYQSAEELAKALDELLEVVKNKTFLRSNVPDLFCNVVGRGQELREIHNAFKSGKKKVFLHGFGGIGKSTVALEYAKRFKSEYDLVLFWRYKGSLESFVNDIDIVNYDSISFSEKENQLKNLIGENVLIIIDNLDVTINQYNDLKKSLPFTSDACILITSRTDFSSFQGEYGHIEIETLEKNDLHKLFCTACGKSIDFSDTLKNLFLTVRDNTYAVYLLGRQLVASHITVDELAGTIVSGIYGLSNSEWVNSNKDEELIDDKTIPEIISALFNIANLSEAQKLTLRNLCALRFLNLDGKTYKQFSGEGNLNIVNSLIKLGWVLIIGDCFSLHPLVEEVVAHEMPPCEENCPGLFGHMRQLKDDFIKPDGFKFSGYHNDKTYLFFLRMLNALNIMNDSNFLFALDLIESLFVFRVAVISDELVFREKKLLLQKLEEIAEEKYSDFSKEKCRVRYLVFIDCFSECRILESEISNVPRIGFRIWNDYKDAKSEVRALESNLILKFNLLFDSIQLLDISQKAQMISNLQDVLDSYHHLPTCLFNLIKEKREYGLNVDDNYPVFEHYQTNLNDFFAQYSLYSIKKVERDDSLSYCDKMIKIMNSISEAIEYALYDDEAEEWKYITEELLPFEFSLINKTKDGENKEVINIGLENYYCHAFVAYGAMNSDEKAVSFAKQFIDSYFIFSFAKAQTTQEDFYDFLFLKFLTDSGAVGKAYLIIPYIAEQIDRSEKLSGRVFQKSMILDPLATVAKRSLEQPGIPDSKKSECLNLAKKFVNKAESLSGRSFDFKSEY